ncbi:MAG: alpha/beta hydrolase [Steroidobacteraceae bacterium]
MLRVLVAFGLVILLAVAGLIVAGRTGRLAADPAEARSLYGAPPSQFMDIDGARLHFRDEGTGPILVLLHGSRASLHQWDGWVAELGGQYRIIRVDALAHGLTANDGGDFSAQRQGYLLDRLLERLGAQHFALAGTSSGATQAIDLAARHPEQVEKLLLSTVPLRLPSRQRLSVHDRLIFFLHDEVLGSKGTDLYWRTFLQSIYGDPSRVTQALVTRYRILNTLPGREEQFQARLASWQRRGGAARDYALAGKVRVPVLVQWGGAGSVLPRELHCEIVAAFTAATVTTITYPELGHKLVMEDPVRTARDAAAFLRASGERSADDGQAGAPAAGCGLSASRSLASVSASSL